MKLRSVLLSAFALMAFNSQADTADISYCADTGHTTIKHLKYQYQSAPQKGRKLFMFVSANHAPTGKASCSTHPLYDFYLDMTDEHQAAVAKSIETAHANGDSVHLRGSCTCLGWAGHETNAENVAMFKIN